MRKLTRDVRCCSIFSAIFAVVGLACAEKPNIILIVGDDLGWSDVGCNGATFYETPNFDRLAAEGMKFNRAYSGGPNCAPTRACIMTGTYTPCHQIWTPGGKSKGKNNEMKLLVPSKGNSKSDTFASKTALDPSVVSLAEVLKPAGYRTAMLGKWHLDNSEHQGFELFSADGTDAPYKDRYSSPTVAGTLTDRAVQFIEDNRENPFFLYLAHWDVHTPHRAKQEVVAKYQAKLESGAWDHDWNPVYAAMIEAFDTSVGRVREAVEKNGLAENTLIIVTSDNGAAGKVKTGPLKGAKGSLCEGGVRVPTAMLWPGTIQRGSMCDVPITSVDFMPTFADLAGAALPTTQPLNGTSLVPLLKDPNHAWENASISGYTEKAADAKVGDVYLCVRTEKYRYINYGDGTEEFYDCIKDPHEWTNLTRNPEYEQLIEQHKAMLPSPAKPMGGKVRGKKSDDDQSQKKKAKKKA